MAACEKCWTQAYNRMLVTGKSQTECYQELIKLNNCTPEEQAGIDASKCQECNRKTVNPNAAQCMNFGWTPNAN